MGGWKLQGRHVSSTERRGRLRATLAAELGGRLRIQTRNWTLAAGGSLAPGARSLEPGSWGAHCSVLRAAGPARPPGARGARHARRRSRLQSALFTSAVRTASASVPSGTHLSMISAPVTSTSPRRLSSHNARGDVPAPQSARANPSGHFAGTRPIGRPTSRRRPSKTANLARVSGVVCTFPAQEG